MGGVACWSACSEGRLPLGVFGACVFPSGRALRVKRFGAEGGRFRARAETARAARLSANECFT